MCLSDGTVDVALAKDSVVNSYRTGEDLFDWCLDIEEYVMLPAFGQAPSHPAMYNSEVMDEETVIIVQEGLAKLGDDDEGREILNDLLNTDEWLLLTQKIIWALMLLLFPMYLESRHILNNTKLHD